MTSPRPTGCVQVQTTAASEQEADHLANAVLQSRSAACVQVVGPIRSRYWWQGRLESATEWLCLVKTAEDRVDEVIAALRAAHPYDMPELVVVAIVGGDDNYLRWIADTVHEGRGER